MGWPTFARTFWVSELFASIVKPPTEQKLNYDKGDYAALRSYLDCDWDKHFDAVALDVDEMWNIFKTKLIAVLRNLFL